MRNFIFLLYKYSDRLTNKRRGILLHDRLSPFLTNGFPHPYPRPNPPKKKCTLKEGPQERGNISFPDPSYIIFLYHSKGASLFPMLLPVGQPAVYG